ncbi:MAG: OadG family protein, partial [Blastochloris sp.]|nr:OadG family protein [Blastochloris sp.]
MMTLPSPPLILGWLSRDAGMVDNLQYQVVGLLIVFTALTLIWVAVSITGFFFRKIPVVIREKGTEGEGRSVPKTGLEGTLDPALLAVISAAVHAAVPLPHQIKKIAFQAKETPILTLQPW